MKTQEQKYPVRFVSQDGVTEPYPRMTKREIKQLLKRYRRWRRRGYQPDDAGFFAQQEDPNGVTFFYMIFFKHVIRIEVIKDDGIKVLDL